MKLQIKKNTGSGSRRATSSELRYLEEREWLYINYFMDCHESEMGKVWIELGEHAEREGFFIDED